MGSGPTTWFLGLSSWIVQDGNYGDFNCGQRVELAVEFGFETFDAPLEPCPVAATRLEGSTYELSARVVAVEADVWVIDAGLLMFNQAKAPPRTAVGDIVTGRAYVGVDPFFYFESLAHRASLPALIYTWTISKIVRQTAPFIDTDGGRMRARDPSKLAWASVPETNAWKDDGGNAEYALECVRHDEPPRRTSATAT